MIEIEHELLLSPREACALIPGRSGKKLSLSTIWRWMLKGRQGHRLESILIGGRRFTTQKSVQDFIAACNGASNNQRDNLRVSESHEPRSTRLQRIEQALQSEGF